MDIKPSFENKNRSQVTELSYNFDSAHQEDLEAIIQALVNITSLTPDQIKPHLDTMFERLMKPKDRPFYETATPEEWTRALREWAESHQGWNAPLLSDEAVSRRGIYEEE